MFNTITTCRLSHYFRLKTCSSFLSHSQVFHLMFVIKYVTVLSGKYLAKFTRIPDSAGCLHFTGYWIVLSGSGTFLSEGRLTRHKRSKHEVVIQKLCKEIADKIQEEKFYPDDIKMVEGLKPIVEFANFVSEAFSKFARKCKQDVLLVRFYGEIYKNWKRFFPASDSQIAVNVLFIHFPQKLVAYHKQPSTAEASEV